MGVETRTNNPLLLSRRSPVLHTDPFFFFEVDDFLPADVYQEALAAFPERPWFEQEIEGNKLRFSTRETPEVVARLTEEHSVWSKVLGWMQDPAFLADLYDLVREGLIASRGRLGSRPWAFDPHEGVLQRLRRQPATTEFEFSRLEPGAFVPAHTDSIYKLVSALLYFPSPEWDEGYGGDTVYYKAKRGQIDNWRNDRLNVDDLEPFHVNRFVPNRLAVFLKSAHSHHAVSPITCPPEVARNSLNFNVYSVPGRASLAVMRARSWGSRRLRAARKRVGR